MSNFPPFLDIPFKNIGAIIDADLNTLRHGKAVPISLLPSMAEEVSPMEYSELIDRILSAEQNARQLTQQAREQERSLEASLEQEAEALRASYLERSRRRVESMEQEERRQAQKRLEELDREHQAALRAVEDKLSRHGDAWADVLFRMITEDEA